MKRRTLVLGVVIGCFALPALAVVVGAAASYFETRATGSLHGRDYIVHVPASYDASKPTALVLSLHGGKTDPALQMAVSEFNRVADKHGFIAAYPGGLGGALKVWQMRGDRDPPTMPDVLYISALIDRLQASYNIDPSRIYANGVSNGGGMAFVLSCTLPHRIAAVGVVGAAYFQPFEWCRDRRPVPVAAFHGTGDRMARYTGGPHKLVAPNHAFPDIPAWMAKWARRNSCDAAPTQARMAPDAIRLEYRGCAKDASVVLYTLEGGGHTWPGGMEVPAWLFGPTPRSVDASEVMWEFFKAHPLR